MIIEETDFRITSGASNYFWDLELLHTVKPKGGPERKEFKDAGYGMLLRTCMQRVINHRMANEKEVYTLKEYVEDYKKYEDEIKMLLKDL